MNKCVDRKQVTPNGTVTESYHNFQIQGSQDGRTLRFCYLCGLAHYLEGDTWMQVQEPVTSASDTPTNPS